MLLLLHVCNDVFTALVYITSLEFAPSLSYGFISSMLHHRFIASCLLYCEPDDRCWFPLRHCIAAALLSFTLFAAVLCCTAVVVVVVVVFEKDEEDVLALVLVLVEVLLVVVVVVALREQHLSCRRLTSRSWNSARRREGCRGRTVGPSRRGAARRARRYVPGRGGVWRVREAGNWGWSG